MAETLDSSSKMEHEGGGVPAFGAEIWQMTSNTGTQAKQWDNTRAEIDTSAPFESVREAVTRFGGIGYWKPSQHKHCEAEDMEGVDIEEVEEQASQMEKDLIMKEKETLEVLKELEATKMIVEELKQKLQKETSEINMTFESSGDDKNADPAVKEAAIVNHANQDHVQKLAPGSITCPSSAPGLILMELRQAKLNLSRTTSDLAEIRASVEHLNKKLEKERNLLEKTRERLSLNSSKVSALEEELNQTKLKLRLANANGYDNHADISAELQRLSSEAEQFKKMGEVARSEVLRAMSEIEQTKMRIKTAEIRLVAARKMKEAAKATEAVALAEIKALSNRESSSHAHSPESEGVTLSYEEYSTLTCKAQDAEEESNRRVVDAMLRVDEANVSKTEILRRVEEATEEVKTTKKALEEALNRVDAANKGKLAVEEALRKWRSDHGQKRRAVQNSTKFKNSYPSQHRRDPHLRDVNGLNLANEGSSPVLKPTLSIGQILSRKLLVPEEIEMTEKGTVKRKVSLGQILNKQNGDVPSSQKAEKENSRKQFSGKRKKFGFARFSLLLAKQSKKKKPTLNLR